MPKARCWSDRELRSRQEGRNGFFRSGGYAIDFIDGTAFSHKAGELRFEAGAGNTTVVLGDINGDGAADFAIILQGTFTLHASDFDL